MNNIIFPTNTNNTNQQYDFFIKKCRLQLLQQQYFFIQLLKYKKINYNILLKIYHDKNWITLMNYSNIFMIKKQYTTNCCISIQFNQIIIYYNNNIIYAKSVFHKKNADYGNVWKIMSVLSLQEIILQKIHRIIFMYNSNQQSCNNIPSIIDNYIDILNYSIFILIKTKTNTIH